MFYQRLLSSILLLLASFIFIRGHQFRRTDNSHSHRRLAVTSMPVIVTVIDSTTNLEELCYTFQTLVRAKGFPSASILAFHGLRLDDTTLDMLQACTNRDVTFVDITTLYSVFPDNFVPTPGVNYDKQQTERFFVTDLWGLPHVEAHDVIFRINDSSCLTMEVSCLYHFCYVVSFYELTHAKTHCLYCIRLSIDRIMIYRTFHPFYQKDLVKIQSCIRHR